MVSAVPLSGLTPSGSLKLGVVQANSVMRTLQIGDRPTKLAQAVAELGLKQVPSWEFRIGRNPLGPDRWQKSCGTLRTFVGQPPMRRPRLYSE